MFTDSHCHITKSNYGNIHELIDRAKNNRILKIINNSTDYQSAMEVLDISSKYKEIYPSLGFHPEVSKTYKLEELKIIEENIKKIVAIGEIGLDYHYDNTDRKGQIDLFEKQLKLAKKYNKPVIVHSRDATEDTINILKKYPKVRGAIHCFTGSLETAKIYIKMGYKLGIGGVLTFKNSNLYKVIDSISTDSIILETDAPYLTPEPYRGRKNEPANIFYIAQKICQVKNITLEELSKITEKNIHDIFDI